MSKSEPRKLVPDKDTKLDGLVLPNIPVKIIRQGDKVKFSAGGYELELKQMPGAPNQTYSLLLLDKFVTEATTKLLQKELDKRENKAAAVESLKQLGVDNAEESADNVVRQIHNAEFGEQ